MPGGGHDPTLGDRGLERARTKGRARGKSDDVQQPSPQEFEGRLRDLHAALLAGEPLDGEPAETAGRLVAHYLGLTSAVRKRLLRLHRHVKSDLKLSAGAKEVLLLQLDRYPLEGAVERRAIMASVESAYIVTPKERANAEELVQTPDGMPGIGRPLRFVPSPR